MKFLAFVDLHGWYNIIDELHKKVDENKIDVLLCSGDITVFGREINLVLKRLNEIGCKIVMIHGNHEDPTEMGDKCEKYENLVFIHKSSYSVDNYIFFGFGGDGFSKRDEDFKRVSKMFEKDYNSTKEDDTKLIVLLHGPPFGTKLDLVGENHVGNKDYSDFIKSIKPNLVVCGHIHENSEKKDKIGDSIVVNPGNKGMIFDI
ncbi:MAG: metallophosphoesterase [Candidatus Woesearchaeota archaeon]